MGLILERAGRESVELKVFSLVYKEVVIDKVARIRTY